jgi:predicted O-methyltransferase YrrM
LKEYPNVSWIEKYSTEAIEDIDRELDYVFVDGNHEYEYVKSDIENYYPLLKEGGILAGDDANWTGVAHAVTEFEIENAVQPHFENKCSNWFFIKGRSIDTTEPLPYSGEANSVTKEKYEI